MTCIGVDVGLAAVRAAQCRLEGDRYVVCHAAQCERPATAPDRPGDPAIERRLLEDCLRKARFRGRSAAAALASPDVEYHALDLPATALETDADTVVRFEVERLLTQPDKGFESRHWRLPATATPAHSAIAIAASTLAIERVRSVVIESRLACVRVDAGAAALARFACALGRGQADTLWGVLDLGDRQSRLIVCIDTTPVLIRSAGTGGRAWTQRIAEQLQVSFKAAEIHKRTVGIARSSPSREVPVSGSTRSELSSLLLGALRLDLNELAGEVKRSYEYVLGCFPGRKVADLLLVGGGALLGNLPEFLSQTLGIPVRRASEYLQATDCRLDWSAFRHEPLEPFAQAIGVTIEE